MAKEKVDVVKVKETAVVKRCTCAHPGQDKLHGLGNRVFNMDFSKVLHCTVCGTTLKAVKV